MAWEDETAAQTLPADIMHTNKGHLNNSSRQRICFTVMFHAVLIQINFDSQLDCKYQSRMQYKLRLVLEQLHRKATH